jgi:hypothetical protein
MHNKMIVRPVTYIQAIADSNDQQIQLRPFFLLEP